MSGVPNMFVPRVLLVAIVASIFAAASSPCTAGQLPTADAKPMPLVENLPTSAAAQDFIRTWCGESNTAATKASGMCYELLLPYATSINGSYNRAALAAVTVMVSKLTTYARELGSSPEYKLGECIKVVNEAIGGAKEAMTKLNRLDAIGDDNVGMTTPDLVDVANWIMVVSKNFLKCQDDSQKNYIGDHASAVAADYSIYVAEGLIISHRPYWPSALPSPDGSGP